MTPAQKRAWFGFVATLCTASYASARLQHDHVVKGPSKARKRGQWYRRNTVQVNTKLSAEIEEAEPAERAL